MRRLPIRSCVLLMVVLFASPVWAGVTGKIAGTITDKATGDPLPGANVVLEGTQRGAATNIAGNFTILQVPPGTYNVKISMIGYVTVAIQDIQVKIDQTSRIDVQLEIEAIAGEEVIIIAERDILREDVATSVISVSNDEVEELPVNSVTGVVGLQAGIRGGLSIRGGGADEALFLLDGVTLRDPRNNQPMTRVALSAVQEISVERGGFNAEYGQVQAGLVNVVTKEGDRDAYHGSFTTRYSPPAAKYWRGNGIPDVHDADSHWLRPFLDPEVAWTGTNNGAWEEYTKDQYPEFEGWNVISHRLLTDNDPTNDLTPKAAQQVFLYEVRKAQPRDEPDYDLDGGFGGPVPFLSDKLGNLRFFSSYRKQRSMLLFPLTRDDYVNYDWTTQVTSDIRDNMKLRVSALGGKEFTMEHNWAPGYYPKWPTDIADVVGSGELFSLFSDWNFALTDISHQAYAAKLTHTLNQYTYYEVSLERISRKYYTRPTDRRDTETLFEVIPGYFRDESPFGYAPEIVEGLRVTGSSHAAKARDFSRVSATTFKADLSRQINFANLVKAGVEFVYNDLDLDYGVIASASAGKDYSTRTQMRNYPMRAAMYLQDKLETNGFTLNAGLRLDYSNSNTDWWAVDTYEQDFFSTKYNEDKDFGTEASESQWQLSPRLGISHPITETSKLFFNYGHFKQMPQYETLFRVNRRQDNSLQNFGDPNLTLAKTISYELGYDHILSNNYLLQLSAYYKDITDQQSSTNFTSIRGFAYNLTTSNNYEDIRGFELSLRKTTGRWFSGFMNYTYQVSTSGHFGSAEQYQDPAEQREYDEATTNLYQNRPTPAPYARANLYFKTPDDYGPQMFGQNLLGGYRLNLLLDWSDGGFTTWNPKEIAKVSNNVEVVDYFDASLRFTKNFSYNQFQLEFMVDVYNLFNEKRLFNNWDRDYRLSLHLPESEHYDNIPGDDKIGDYRKPGVEFQPMYARNTIDPENDTGQNGAIYFEMTTGNYLEYADGAWAAVEQSRIDQIKENNAYIDMPNASTWWFLNPRDIFFGFRITFDFDK